mmetsp:Transcript_51594/g.63115  ORF Transcript_51594/g.63115 Transcript_51594/m.63115 type:complete len:207 (-) Transcript_51594:152-772(-)
MRALGWNTHGGATAGETRVAKDLLGLPHHFHLLLGVAIGLKTVNVRNDVEGQGVGKDLIGMDLALQGGFGALLQLRHTLRASSTGGLVGGNNDFFQLEVLVQRPQGHGSNGGGAVGVGDQKLALHCGLVDLRHHKRHCVVISEGRGVVDDHRLAIGRDLGGILRTEATRHRHEHHVAALRHFHAKGFDLLLSEGGHHAFARGSLRS